MRVLEPEIISVLTTSRCTAACRHCCMNSGPDRDDTLKEAQLFGILEQIFAHLSPKVIVFTGGEPFLLGDTLTRAIRRCSDQRIGTRVITNAYWASSAAAALSRLSPLKAAGLDDLTISTDDYHLPWISVQRVRNAHDAAVSLGFAATVLSTCSGPNSAITPEALERSMGHGDGSLTLRFDASGESQVDAPIRGAAPTGEAAPAGAPAQRGIISNAHTQALGRGIEALWHDETWPEPPPDGTLEGGCPWALRWPAISPRGHLLACCGFELEDNPMLDYGDLAEHDLVDLVDLADADMVTNAIALLGPPTLKKVLEEICPDEVSFPRPVYRGICEVCTDLVTVEKNRRALIRHLDVLAPLILRARERAGADPAR